MRRFFCGSSFLALTLLIVMCPDWAHAAAGGAITYNDVRISDVVRVLFEYLEGTFGALIMVCAGIFTIIMASMGQYRAALALMVVGIGAFTLRSFMSTFFNDVNVNGPGGPSSVSVASAQGGGRIAASAGGSGLTVFTCPGGSVVALHAGTVVSSGPTEALGNRVTVQQTDGGTATYGRLAQFDVHPGSHVSAGQRIGTVGNSGLNADNTPRLYFSVSRDGRSVSPSSVVPGVKTDQEGHVRNPEALIPKLVVPREGCQLPPIQTGGSFTPSGHSSQAPIDDGDEDIGRF